MNRSELLYLYDIADANPNGDPLDDNKQIISRGGCSNWTTTGRQASYRSKDTKNIKWSCYLNGFRVVLYVQD